MAYGVLITLTDLGGLVGPFDLYSNLDGYTTPFETNIPVSAFLYGGYYTTSLPYGTTIIKVKSDGDCINFINLPIIDLPTFTPTATSTPSPTPSITASNTMTPTQTGTIPVTPTQTVTKTQTPSVTPTLTSTPSRTPSTGQLIVNAKFRNSEAYLEYQVNSGPTESIGNIDSLSCINWTTISGLTSGDSILFTTIGGYILAQSNSDCPDSGFACDQTYVFGGGIATVYITVDGSTGC
jgi:hypothetical protein